MIQLDKQMIQILLFLNLGYKIGERSKSLWQITRILEGRSGFYGGGKGIKHPAYRKVYRNIQKLETYSLITLANKRECYKLTDKGRKIAQQVLHDIVTDTQQTNAIDDTFLRRFWQRLDF